MESTRAKRCQLTMYSIERAASLIGIDQFMLQARYMLSAGHFVISKSGEFQLNINDLHI